jgi:hypothetical protein
MAKRTFLELAQRVYQECGASGSVPANVTGQTGLKSKIVDWTADAIYEIESLWSDWKFLSGALSQALVLGDRDYEYVSDWDAPHDGTFYIDGAGNDFWPLTEMDYDLWWRTYRGLDASDTSNQDRPSHVIWGPDAIIVHPVPDTAYTLAGRYSKMPTRVTTNTSESLIPEKFEQAIIALAKMKFAEHEGAAVMLANSQSEYNLWLSALEANQRPRQQHRSNDNTEQLVVRPV